MNFSTDHRPFASTSRSKIPALAVPEAAPLTAVAYTVRTTSRLISDKISAESIFANSVSASRPWIALRSCANSEEYSAFNARDLAVTATFSISKAISAIGLVSKTGSIAAVVSLDTTCSAPPFASALAVVIPVPVVKLPSTSPPDKLSGLPVASAPCVPVPEKSVSASLNKASVPSCVLYLERIAKIRPVGPVIG